MRYVGQLLFSLCLLVTTLPLTAATVGVAVASNFTATLHQLAVAFTRKTGHELRISSASTGKLYAQIVQGAPYDVFLAADADHPGQLVRLGLALANSRFTYAQGQLLLWSPRSGFSGEGKEVLAQGGFRHLAIANPKTAPYGAAAKQTLESLGLWTVLKSQLVRGENIGQTFQYIASGAADLGFISRSQAHVLGNKADYRWPVPAHLHAPIRQQAVLLSRSAESLAAIAFLAFLRTDEAAELIVENGYLSGDRASR